MSEIDFKGQAVIVTGAARGLGRAYAVEIGRRGGGAVVVNDIGVNIDGSGRSRGPADAVVEEIRAAGGKAVASYDNVAEKAGGEAICRTALGSFGRIDAVINNAAIQRGGPFEEITEDDLDVILGIQVRGAFYVTQPAFRVMKDQKYGRILLTSSATGMFGSRQRTDYAAAKGALFGLMNGIALEGQSFGILCNSLLPGAMTRLATKLSPDLDKGAAAISDPFKDKLDPAFVAPLVLYLISRRCDVTQCGFSAVGNRFAYVFAGVTEGWLARKATPATVEEVAEHIGEILDLSRFHTPKSTLDELKLLSAQWTKA
jgi:NAD(P)-dependent dehydrogenase (short-subunit alcohol dehydrogenase family)